MRGVRRLAAGVRVGPYELGSPLGGGDDTEVWRADGDGVVVALKLARDERDPFVRARLAREAAALQRVDDPAVVRLLDAGDIDGVGFLALELHDAAPLSGLLDDGRLSLDVASAVLAPVARALVAAHAVGVVHRDVKPGNILLAARGPVLVDFGAAALDGTTVDGWIDGVAVVLLTEGYAAPEIEMGVAVSESADVWSLAVTLAECLCGSTEIAAARAALPAALGACLALDPQARPSMAFVADELERSRGTTFAPFLAPVVPASGSTGAKSGTTAPEIEVVVEESGRELELARLVDLHDATRASEELRAVLVVAPPGQGKTWLLDTFAADAVDRSTPVLRATCSEQVGDLRALAPWVRRFGAALADHVGAAHAATLGALVGDADTGGADEDAVAAALSALLADLDAPVAIVDDLHHARPELLEVLGRLAFRPRTPGLLVLGARPGHIDSDDLDVETLTLGPLPDDVIARIADADEDAISVAGGNPLLARELALANERGDELDGDVRSLIAHRLSALEPIAGDALALAAACGDVIWPEAVGPPLREASAVLFRAGLVEAQIGSTLHGSTEATWTHPLLREVAYDRLDDAARREAHARLARALDETAPAETIAFHAGRAWHLGEESLRELTATRAVVAARDALDRFALSTAEDMVSLIRDVATEREAGIADITQAQILVRRGDFAGAVELVGDRTARPALEVLLEAHVGLGEYAAAQALGAQLLSEDSLLPLPAVLAYGTAMANEGDPRGAAKILGALVADAAGVQRLRLEARVALLDTQAAAIEGAPTQPAISRALRLVSDLDRAGDSRLVTEIAYDVAEVIGGASPSDARAVLGIAHRNAIEVGDTVRATESELQLAQIAIDTGDVTSAAQHVASCLRASIPSMRLEVKCLDLALRFASGRDEPWDELDEAAESARGAGVDVIAARALAVTVPMWFGRVDRARRALPQLAPAAGLYRLAELALRALEGPPWPTSTPADDHRANNELALIHFLAGDVATADALLRDRHRALEKTGLLYQRYNQFFPGALVAALGPDDTAPNIEWLEREILDSPLELMWGTHKALSALVMVERGQARSNALAAAALALLERLRPDERVYAWIRARLESAREISAR